MFAEWSNHAKMMLFFRRGIFHTHRLTWSGAVIKGCWSSGLMVMKWWWSSSGGVMDGNECHRQLLERQVNSVARLCSDQSLLSLCQRRLVAGLSTLYKVNSNSNHCLFIELPSASTRVRPQLIHWSVQYQGVQRLNLICLFCRLRFECEWPSLHCVWHRNAGWVQGRSQALVASLSCLFLSFPWRRCLWGCESN